jgi:hypothetical protein
MNLIERIQKIIISPKTEWEIISEEEASVTSIFTTYVLPLALVAALATCIGYTFIGLDSILFKMKGINWGLRISIMQLIAVGIGYYITTYVMDAIAPSFGSEKNINKTAQLIGYSYTPALIGGLLNVIPSLAWIGSLFGLYSIYLLYIGLVPLKKTPEDKKTPYLIVTVLILIVVYFIATTVLGGIVNGILGVSGIIK